MQDGKYCEYQRPSSDYGQFKKQLIALCSKVKTKEVLAIRHIYSNKKETSDFHGTVSFDPVKMSQQK